MENLPELSPKVNASNRNVQLKLPIEDAPPRVRAFGLRTLDRRPLVGERDATGRICRAFRTSSAKAWAYSDVGYPHSATQWGAVVVDVDAPAKLEDVLHNSGSLLPNWVTLNKRNGHAHVAFPLETPVACHPAANEKPLAYLSDIEKKLISALGGDPNYSGALARNPITRPRWGTSTIWLRTAPWSLAELDEAATAALPDGWTPARAATGGIGRNCDLFLGLMRWAGRESNRFESLKSQADAINCAFESPLPLHEVRATVKSVLKYRRKWERRGWHSARWIRKQSARGKMGAAASAKVRGEGSNEERRPWESQGIGRSTWYSRKAKK